MAQTLKFGNGTWATKKGSTLAFNDEDGNYKPLPFTTTRSTSATRVNKEGLIEVVTNDRPRIDYTDSAKGVLLLEPSRTNQVPYSQTYTSGWNFDNSTIIENSTISPDGNINAGLWKGNTVSSRHNIGVTLTPVGSVTGSFSLFVKAKELKYLQIASANTVNQYVNFDVESGIIGTVGSSFSNAKIENYGNGWYRISVVSPNQYNGYYISLVSGLTATWLESWIMPNNTDGLYIFGAQIEEGSYPTSYIPTQGASATRVADTASGSGNSEVFNDSEGVLFADISALVDSTSQRWISVGSGGNANRVSILFNATSKINCSVRGSSAAIYDAFANIGSQTIVSKAAVKYKNSDFAFFVNGFKVDSQQSGSVSFNAPLSELAFDSADGGSDFYGKTKELAYYNTILTDLELETLTSYSSLSELVTELNLNTL